MTAGFGAAGTALGLLNSYSSDTPKSGGSNTSFAGDAIQEPSVRTDPPHESKPPKSAAPEEVAADKAFDPSQVWQPPQETVAVMEKLVAFVKVGFPPNNHLSTWQWGKWSADQQALLSCLLRL